MQPLLQYIHAKPNLALSFGFLVLPGLKGYIIYAVCLFVIDVNEVIS